MSEKRREEFSPCFEGAQVTMQELFFELDYAGAVVDADGAELAEYVLAEEPVERGTETFRQVAQVHHRNGLGKEETASEFEVDSDSERIADNADLTAGRLGWEQEASAVGFDVEDGVVRAGIKKQGHRFTVHFGIDEEHGVDGTKREKNRSGASNDWRREEQRERPKD